MLAAKHPHNIASKSAVKILVPQKIVGKNFLLHPTASKRTHPCHHQESSQVKKEYESF